MPFDFDDLFIFEMANNHQGQVSHGLRIIEEMAKVKRRFGIKAAVKLQYRHLDTFIHPDFVGRDDVKHIPRFLQTRLTPEQFNEFICAIRDNDMLTCVTSFDEASVQQCLNHGVDILKIASCSANDWPLLAAIAVARKPVICSTGGCGLKDIDKIVNFFEHRDVKDLALLHCVGIYPAPNESINLGFMQRMMTRYRPHAIGYSGHEDPDNTDVAKIAIATGAKIVERHVGVPTDEITLNKYSSSPDQVAAWVEAALAAKTIVGDTSGSKAITEDELASLRSLMRGVFAKEPIKAGQPLKPEKVFFAMPCSEGQMTTKEYLETVVASKDYAANEALMERRPHDPVAEVRSVVHEAKALLREAQISTGTDFTVDLSHHYGMNDFRRVGAIVVNIINREYCKKLIILLPGQYHPSHKHLKKEETFQVLYGEMELELDGKTMILKPGDIMLVERETMHSFSSRTGCIFEEISTTHIVGDSVYEDPEIAKFDPMQRKTTLDSW